LVDFSYVKLIEYNFMSTKHTHTTLYITTFNIYMPHRKITHVDKFNVINTRNMASFNKR